MGLSIPLPGLDTLELTPRRRSALETGQGPFKPSQSSRRALFGIEKAIRDLQLYVGRIDPQSASDDSTSERALLRGVTCVLQGAQQMEKSAKDNLLKLKARPKSGSTVSGTPVHKDPRNAMRDQLMRCQREAHEAALLLES